MTVLFYFFILTLKDTLKASWVKTLASCPKHEVRQKSDKPLGGKKTIPMPFTQKPALETSLCTYQI